MIKAAAVSLLYFGAATAHNVNDVHVQENQVKTHQAHATEGRGAHAGRPFLELVYDDFVVEAQDLCDGSSSFQFGECTVSFALKDLKATEFEHVFEAEKCGDHDVLVIMDMDDKVPMHAMSFHTASMDWKELFVLPNDYLVEGETLGCREEITPKKACPVSRRLGQERSVAETYADKASGFPQWMTPGNNRRLAACSSYKVIKIGLKFDSRFCHEHGGTEATAKAYLGGVIAEMNKYFEPMCIKIEGCSISGVCGSNDPLKAIVDSATSLCNKEPTSILDQFQAYVGGNLEGCHAMHMVYGGNPGFVLGCAEVCTLCEGSKSTGLENFLQHYALINHVYLLSHEIGHNIGVDADYYPEEGNDTTYFMGSGLAGFKPERQEWIKNFVNAKSCVGSVSASGTSSSGGDSGSSSVDCGSNSYNFEDSEGYTCDDYDANQDWCDDAANYANDDGCSALNACGNVCE